MHNPCAVIPVYNHETAVPAVVDAECSKAGLPRPVLPVAVGEMIEPAAIGAWADWPGPWSSGRDRPGPRCCLR